MVTGPLPGQHSLPQVPAGMMMTRGYMTDTQAHTRLAQRRGLVLGRRGGSSVACCYSIVRENTCALHCAVFTAPGTC